MMLRRDVIVVGASAGGFEAIQTFLAALPVDFDATVAITIHRSPTFVSDLVSLFARRCKLRVTEPRQGERVEPNHVYLAPQDVHMMFADGSFYLSRGPKQHHTRPAIDPLFQSAADGYGRRVIGVLLTGNLSDGVTGLITIKNAGGITLAQDPAEAAFPSMPTNALLYDHVDLAVRLASLVPVLVGLVAGQSVRRVAKTNGAPRK